MSEKESLRRVLLAPVSSKYESTLIEKVLETLMVETSDIEISLYVRLERDGIGGGHGTGDTWTGTPDELLLLIKKLSSYGIKFYYQMDGACQNNLEMTGQENLIMRKHAGWVRDSGFHGVIVTNPYLAEMISREFAPLKIITGLTAMVDALPRLQFWFELGAHMAIMDYNLTRDREVLDAIPEGERKKVFIVPNCGCFFGCVRYRFCLNNLSHFSRGEFPLPEKKPAPWCSDILRNKPGELWRSPWLTPSATRKLLDMKLLNLYLLPAGVPSSELIASYGNLKDPVNFSDYLSFFWEPEWRPPINGREASGFLENFPRASCHLIRCSECEYCDKQIKNKSGDYPGS